MKDNATECLSINARAAALGNELRGAKANMRSACAADPAAPECNDRKLEYEGAMQRYRALIGEAPINCRAQLADPSLL
jgi:hypothetical protein